ncbi:hypothetical protein [Cryptosporangium sp. NPDC051539]|uniref:hypothetical protein n=1 Tax=Cryptosporangium sp. NPDC051539 TaxID=3363962 RepID=UPI0037A64C3D
MAQPLTTVRHLHVSQDPLVLVPLKMAGEAGAPMAAMVGTDRANPHLLTVAQPRNRDQRFDFMHQLARIMLAEIVRKEQRRAPVKGGARPEWRCLDAVQIWVPNRAGVELVRLLGRSTRFRRPVGPYPVPGNVPTLGKWLTHYADRALYAGSDLLVAATSALSAHWATGQSAVEDEHLGSLLAWIQPPDGQSGADAADAAEDPLENPPAGPSTDPGFDNTVLARLVERYQRSGSDEAERAQVERLIREQLRTQLVGAWTHTWTAIDLLAQQPPGGHVADRWSRELAQFTRTADWIAQGTTAQPKRDSAVVAARHLHQLEEAQANYDAERALDDPLVMAESRLAGEAFVGEVIKTFPSRRVGKSKRPRIIVETDDPVRLLEGETGLRSPRRPKQKAELIEPPARSESGRLRLLLELSEGMGNRREPEPGSLPSEGEEVTYSLFDSEYRTRPRLPAPEHTPWTHGGPREPRVTVTDEDSREDWS